MTKTWKNPGFSSSSERFHLTHPFHLQILNQNVFPTPNWVRKNIALHTELSLVQLFLNGKTWFSHTVTYRKFDDLSRFWKSCFQPTVIFFVFYISVLEAILRYISWSQKKKFWKQLFFQTFFSLFRKLSHQKSLKKMIFYTFFEHKRTNRGRFCGCSVFKKILQHPETFCLHVSTQFCRTVFFPRFWWPFEVKWLISWNMVFLCVFTVFYNVVLRAINAL